jgi:hypothetical protein
LCFHRRGVEDQPIVFDRKGTEIAEDGLQPDRIVVALTEEIRIARWTMDLFCPQFE